MIAQAASISLRSKAVPFAFICSFLALMMAACGKDGSADAGGYSFDPGQPDQVLQVVFDVASGKAEPFWLSQICSKKVSMGPETRRICEYAGGFDQNGEFPMFFGLGRLNPGGYAEGDLAYQPFSFGPTGQQRDTMVMVKEDGKWFLSHF